MPHAGDRLNDAVDAFVDESVDEVATHALGADLIDIRRAVDRLEAEFIRRLDRFHRAHGAQADGGVTTVSWLRHRCGMTAKAAAYRVHLARTLGELPATLDSARAGRASLGNVTMIAHLANDVGVEQVAPLESILVGAAETLDPGAMRTLTQVTRLRVHPDGVLAADNHAHERRWFECDQTYGGVFVLRGELDAKGGGTGEDGDRRAQPRHASWRNPLEIAAPCRRARRACRDAAALRRPPRCARAAAASHAHGERGHAALRRRCATGRVEPGGSDPSGNRASHCLRCGADGGDGCAVRGCLGLGGRHRCHAALGRTGHTHHPGAPPHRLAFPRPRLPLPGVRPAARMDRRAPRRPLEPWRGDQPRQPRPSLVHPPLSVQDITDCVIPLCGVGSNP